MVLQLDPEFVKQRQDTRIVCLEHVNPAIERKAVCGIGCGRATDFAVGLVYWCATRQGSSKAGQPAAENDHAARAQLFFDHDSDTGTRIVSDWAVAADAGMPVACASSSISSRKYAP